MPNTAAVIPVAQRQRNPAFTVVETVLPLFFGDFVVLTIPEVFEDVRVVQ